MHDVEEGKRACEEEPGLAHHAVWQAQERAGCAEDEVDECVGKARVPLHTEHVVLHYELARAQEAGYVGQAEQVGVVRGEEERHEVFEEVWEAEDGVDEGAASVDGLTGVQ